VSRNHRESILAIGQETTARPGAAIVFDRFLDFLEGIAGGGAVRTAPSRFGGFLIKLEPALVGNITVEISHSLDKINRRVCSDKKRRSDMTGHVMDQRLRPSAEADHLRV